MLIDPLLTLIEDELEPLLTILFPTLVTAEPDEATGFDMLWLWPPCT
jgi:hypothetical protein